MLRSGPSWLPGQEILLVLSSSLSSEESDSGFQCEVQCNQRNHGNLTELCIYNLNGHYVSQKFRRYLKIPSYQRDIWPMMVPSNGVTRLSAALSSVSQASRKGCFVSGMRPRGMLARQFHPHASLHAQTEA